jgi:electron transfer flavoprotein alpha subunit
MTCETYRDVWVFAEQDAGTLTRIGFELLTRGRRLADKRGCALVAVVFAESICDDQLRRLIACGADRVVAVEHPSLAYYLPGPWGACLAGLIKQRRPEILLAGATSTGRTLMPHVAVKVHAGLTADCTELDIEEGTGHLLQTRPAIGGNILATIKTETHRPQMATVRPRSTQPARLVAERQGEIERMEPPEALPPSRVRRVDFLPVDDEHPLQDADRVVTVGRGVKKADNLPVVEEFAEALDAALGATRDVVDRGWLSYPHQIGLSGKTVTPKLYIGAGVGGSIQHLAGMQTAETIVAINTDPEAQLFKVADFGIVGDMHQVLPVLTQLLREGHENPEEPS